MFTKHFWTHGAGSYALAIGVALTIRWAFMEAYVIPSGSISGLLQIHSEVDKVHDYLGVALRLHRTAHQAEAD